MMSWLPTPGRQFARGASPDWEGMRNMWWDVGDWRDSNDEISRSVPVGLANHWHFVTSCPGESMNEVIVRVTVRSSVMPGSSGGSADSVAHAPRAIRISQVGRM